MLNEFKTNKIDDLVAQLTAKKKRRNRFISLVCCICLLVAGATSFAFMQPAITESQTTYCGLEEHKHSDACFTDGSEKILVCCHEEGDIHEHTAECYDVSRTLICPQPEGDVHFHTDDCYTEKPVLVCNQEETEGHTHSEACYTSVSTLACGLEEMPGHIHDASCYTVNKFISCGIPEGDGAHTHSEACFDEVGTLICGKEESFGHVHSADCYSSEEVLSCGLAEGEGAHSHTDACYAVTQELACGLEECEAHQHGDACYELQLVCSCGKPEVAVAHTHTDDCYLIVKNLICTESLDPHVHTDLCYSAKKELTCLLEEHEHTLACFADVTADLESPDIWERPFAALEFTGNWREDVIAVAKTQLGYPESTLNYQVDEFDETKIHGYTRYGAWYGLPYSEWCAMFCSFVYHYAGVDASVMPTDFCGCRDWIETLDRASLWHPVNSGDAYAPQPGDLIFFDVDNDALADHVGLVQQRDDALGMVTTIEGNRIAAVNTFSYYLSDGTILGYGELALADADPLDIPADEAEESEPTGEAEAETVKEADEAAEDTAAEEENAPADTPTHVLSYTGADYSITLVYKDEANIPEGSSLSVYEILPDSQEYDYYAENAAYAVNGSLTTDVLSYARFFDITILSPAGEEIEPSAPVSVTINCSDNASHTGQSSVVHFADDGVVEVIPVTGSTQQMLTSLNIAADDAIISANGNADYTYAFSTDAFSVFGVSDTNTDEVADNRQMLTLFSRGSGETTEPLQISDYIIQNDGLKLEYRNHESISANDWVEYDPTDPSIVIPADSELQLTVTLADVNIETLQSAGCKMVMRVPEIMSRFKVDGEITIGDDIAANITVENGIVQVLFDEDWLNSVKITSDTALYNIYFHITSEIDIKAVEELTPPQIVIGDAKININFGEDVIEEYSTVDVKKSEAELIHNDNNYYLQYTVTAKAGEYGSANVRLEDIFNQNSYTGAYEVLAVTRGGVPCGIRDENITFTHVSAQEAEAGAKEEAPDPSMPKLTWNIGDMAPYEMVEITYRVLLDSSFVNGLPDPLTNTVVAITKGKEGDYEKDRDVSTYEHESRVTINKSTYKTDMKADDGKYYIIYAVTVTAADDNELTLENVVFKDSLDGSISGSTATDSEVLKYLSYDSGYLSIDGKDKSENILELMHFSEDSNGDNKKNESVSINIGSLEKGQSKTVWYKVNVDPAIFPYMEKNGDKSLAINNAAVAVLDEDGDPDTLPSTVKYTINHKQWSRKLAGDKVTESFDVNLTKGKVYDATRLTDGKPTIITSPEDKFTVPAGSYKYQIVANEAGSWDISSASLTDEFNQTWMKYQGYVCITAYQINSKTTNAPTINMADATVIQNLSARSPAKTVWVKVDGISPFNITPKDIDLAGPYAYLLTYYAKPETSQQLAQPVVTNTITIDGQIGIGDITVNITGIEASADVTVETDRSFNAEKLAWYYANQYEVGLSDFKRGALYWVIKANGYIGSGTVLQDRTNSFPSDFNTNSIVGVYKGNLGNKKITDYKDVNALLAAVNDRILTPVNSTDSEGKAVYSIEFPKKTAMTITIQQDIPLDANESLYVVFRTHPSSGVGNRTPLNQHNYLKTKIEGGEFSEEQSVLLKFPKNKYIYKDGYSGEFDGSTMTGDLDDYVPNSTVFKNGVPGAGTYIGWLLTIDQYDNMEGRYQILDDIPAGLTPEFVYLYLWSDKFSSTGNEVECARIQPVPTGWVEHVTTMIGHKGKTSNNTEKTVYWYSQYVDGHYRVMFDIDGLHYPIKNDTGMKFIIGTRITDEQVLLGFHDGNYTNTVKLYKYNEGVLDENLIDQTTADAKNISKTAFTKEIKGSNKNKLSFIITMNPLGEDLKMQDDQITITDTLSANLTLILDSVKVWEKGTENEITDFTGPSVDGQTFTLVVSDKKALEITYDVIVNALPNQVVEINNTAYWTGTTESKKVIINEENYSYDAGGGVSVDTPVNITFEKHDANIPDRMLQGATFILQELEVSENDEGGTTVVVKEEGQLEKTTDENGIIKFGKEDDIKANTVYRLHEIKAPAGYYPAAKDFDFIILKKEKETGTIPEIPIPESLDVKVILFDTEVYPVRDIYDPPIEYALPETGGVGTEVYAISGLALISLAAFLAYRKREASST